jgi:hypothetical protein
MPVMLRILLLLLSLPTCGYHTMPCSVTFPFEVCVIIHYQSHQLPITFVVNTEFAFLPSFHLPLIRSILCSAAAYSCPTQHHASHSLIYSNVSNLSSYHQLVNTLSWEELTSGLDHIN